jgi:hypothetical protein
MVEPEVSVTRAPRRRVLSLGLLVLALAGPVSALPAAQPGPQNPPPPGPGRPAVRRVPPAPKKVGENLVQLGNILVNTKSDEVTVSGRVLPDRVLEFIASTKMGAKSYESAIELDTDAVTFNLAMIMIGLDRSRAVVPQMHFGPNVAGDPVEIWVEWGTGKATRKIRIDELLYDERARKVPEMGAWVYTGSTMYPSGDFAAEVDGVIIGFVHDPASIIENTVGSGINAYGTIRLNPALELQAGTAVTLTVKAIAKKEPQ